MDAIETGAERSNQDALAARLAEVAPSAGVLDELECELLSAAGRLDAVVAWERSLRHTHAGLIRALAALSGAEGGRLGQELAESEVCAALAWAPSTAQFRLGEAGTFTRLFPEALQQVSEGVVSLEQARALMDMTAGLDEQAARAVQERVLDRTPGRSMSATRQAIRRAITSVDPDAAAKKHRHERKRRRVELRPEDDGMATLSFYLPADVAQMAMRTLTELAQSAKRSDKNACDTRTLDQRRADLLPELLLHRFTGKPRTDGDCDGAALIAPARVSVVVGIETLLGLSHEAGHLDGYGPICAEQTREIAGAHGSRWRFLLTASDGTLVEASPRTYTPRAAIKHLTELRHRTCAFPNCSMPADRCDLDHNQPFGKGGPTTADNLAPLCRRHHNHKTRGDWSLDRDGDTIAWTSRRTGRSYTTTGTRYLPTPTTKCARQTNTVP